jgi:hypothetical protein
LRKSVKEAELERRKKEQEVQKLQEELIRKKRLDNIRIRDEITRAEREEKELEQQIIKEKSKLDKVKLFQLANLYLISFVCFFKLHTRREDHYLRLLKQREQIRETKMLLETHEREHERLLRVHVRSQSLQSLNTI